jgi:hypothetical protein
MCNAELSLALLNALHPHIVTDDIDKIIQNFCTKFKENNNSLDLSDWDFTIDIHDTDITNLENKCFIHSHNPSVYIASNKEAIAHTINAYYHKYTIISNAIIEFIKQYRTNIDANNFWTGIYDKIIAKLNKANINLQYMECVSDTYVFPVNFNTPSNTSLEIIPNPNNNNQLLNSTRSVTDFNVSLSKTMTHTKLEQHQNTRLRISNMEVFQKIIYNGDILIDGFDLIRMTLKFNMRVTLFDYTHGIGLLNKIIFAELIDISHSKPITISHLLHGTADYEFDNVVYIPDYTNPQDNNIGIKSYSLTWFIDDVIRISLEWYSPKFNKRLDRLYESIIMLLCKYYIKNEYTIIMYIRRQNPITKKNLLETLELIHKVNNRSDNVLYRNIRKVLYDIIQPVIGGNNSSKDVKSICSLIILYYFPGIIFILCIILLIYYMYVILTDDIYKISGNCIQTSTINNIF